MSYYKNQGSQIFPFGVVDPSNNNQLITGEANNVTAQISIDGGALANTNDANPTEIGNTGVVYFNATQAETNGNFLFVLPEHNSYAFDPPYLFIFTTPGDPTAINGNVVEVAGNSADANNLQSACNNYSATRGLAGTALPDAAADAAGGLPISDAGGLDMDALSTFDASTDGVDVDFIEGTDVTDYFSSLVTTITDAITSATTSILGKLLAYVQLLARKDAAIGTDNATELGEINNDEGSGGGAYDQARESQEAIRDRGDSAWTTGGGGGGGSGTTFVVMPQANLGRATNLPEQPYVGAQANLNFGFAGDVSDEAYRLIIESQTNTADIAEIDSDSETYDMTANVTTVAFTVPANTHDSPVTWQYAVRQNPDTTNRVLARGPYQVKYAPQGD